MSPIEGADADQPSEGWREGFSRRTFLRRGTLAAAAVGVVGSVPGLSGLLVGGSAEAPAAESAATEAESDVAPLAQPLLVHVKDLGTGEISLFQGEQETVVRNPALARQLFTAVRR